jgi:hypothetical protein
MISINPANANFKSADEFKSLMCTMINKHDQLKAAVDSSGKSKEEGTDERRACCWDDFCGTNGRCKDLGLFFCFIVWEGKITRWMAKRLESGMGFSSEDVVEVEGFANSSGGGGKEGEGIVIVRRKRREKEDGKEASPKKRLMASKADEIQAQTYKFEADAAKTVIETIQEQSETEFYKTTPKEFQTTIQQNYMDLLLEISSTKQKNGKK